MELSRDCFRALGPSWVRDVPKTSPGASQLEPLQGMFGDALPVGHTRLTPWWLSMLGFELSLPRGGGVWAAQCLNSLMTALGQCPCAPARHGNDGAAALGLLKAPPCPCTKRVASPWDINGVWQRTG